MLQIWVQLESLKATTDTKEVSFKIAYGLPLAEMLRWGLYISGAVCFIPAVKTPVLWLCQISSITSCTSPCTCPSSSICMQPSNYIELLNLPASPSRAIAAFIICRTCNVVRHQQEVPAGFVAEAD